jgi:hypothetical protein
VTGERPTVSYMCQCQVRPLPLLVVRSTAPRPPHDAHLLGLSPPRSPPPIPLHSALLPVMNNGPIPHPVHIFISLACFSPSYSLHVSRRVLMNLQRRQRSKSVSSSSAVALPVSLAQSRYDAWDIRFLSSKRRTISSAYVPYSPLPSMPISSCSSPLMQSSKYRGIRMPPNMTKIFNYWGMRDKVGEIGVVTDRVVMSRRTPFPS